jgi:AraC-like DNA-binding protein
MKLEQASPAPQLREYVRCFQQRRALISNAPVIYPIAARPDQFLEFYLQDPYAVRFGMFGAQEIVPRAVVVGPCARRRAELVLHGAFDVFTIQFCAAGFYQLFRVPMDALADQAYEARSVIGPLLTELEHRLADAPSFETRVHIAGDLLLRQLGKPKPADAVAAAAGRLVFSRGAISVGDAAARAGLGVRQFERRFIEQVGLPPKLYARIVRFNAALGAKVADPLRLWTDIAHALGYFDQMHMVHDFEDLSGESPTTFMKRLSPETWT